MEPQHADRAIVLLKAALALLETCDKSPFVICPTETTVHYDDADSNGICLMDDINNLLFEVGQ